MQGCYNSKIDRNLFFVSNCWWNISFWMKISISGVLSYLFGSGFSKPKSIHGRNSGFNFLSTDKRPKTDIDSASQWIFLLFLRYEAPKRKLWSNMLLPNQTQSTLWLSLTRRKEDVIWSDLRGHMSQKRMLYVNMNWKSIARGEIFIAERH